MTRTRQGHRWLVFIHQLPAQPSKGRVKISAAPATDWSRCREERRARPTQQRTIKRRLRVAEDRSDGAGRRGHHFRCVIYQGGGSHSHQSGVWYPKDRCHQAERTDQPQRCEGASRTRVNHKTTSRCRSLLVSLAHSTFHRCERSLRVWVISRQDTRRRAL